MVLGPFTAMWLSFWIFGCGDAQPPPDRVAAAETSTVAQEDVRPAILLVVVDTLRADAVSAYGEAEGTTPTIDRLASEGLLYRNAFAPSPWTLPSHATLFSGLRIDQHGVGLHGRYDLPEDVDTIAERLGEAGYRTAGFSENLSVSRGFQLAQGFDTFASTPPGARVPTEVGEHHRPALDVVAEIGRWLDRQDLSAHPVFVFANLFQAHSPYQIRPTNEFLPEGVGREQARTVKQREAPQRYLCGALPSQDDLEIMHGLYLGDVAAADARLARLLETVRAAMGTRPLITIVVSDHGEHFGEHRLLSHRYSVRDAVLRVPMIVHGLPGIAPGVIDEPVGLLDVVPSILHWSGSESAPGLAGRVLPTSAQAGLDAAPRSLIAAYHDDEDTGRKFCAPSDRVFGDMLSLTRYPFKMIWFEDGEMEMYDLSWDRGERSNLRVARHEETASLERELLEFIEQSGIQRPPEQPARELSEQARESLRALGYVE